MDKIKNQLAGVAALLGVIAAIGGGFVKYGEITTKLDALESAGGKDWSAQIAVLEEKVEALKNIEQGIASLGANYGQGNNMNQSSNYGDFSNFGIGSFFPPYGGLYG